jgi:aryl-alcohol dehydrogenase-like predicted oxidoreductase
MERRPLGRSGVSVTKLCLGAVMFGAWGNTGHDDSIRIIHRALDAGINFIDTADIYSQGESEEIVGKALAGSRRDEVVLATKFWGQMGEEPNRGGVSRRWIIHEVESSVQRLDTDRIDLYQVRYEPGVELEETLAALTDLVQQGKVRYIGTSAADEAGIPLVQLAIAWAANHPAVTAPITGPRTMEQLEGQLPAADLVLDQALLDRIDEIVPPGVNLTPADGGWVNPSLQPQARRR